MRASISASEWIDSLGVRQKKTPPRLAGHRMEDVKETWEGTFTGLNCTKWNDF